METYGVDFMKQGKAQHAPRQREIPENFKTNLEG